MLGGFHRFNNLAKVGAINTLPKLVDHINTHRLFAKKDLMCALNAYNGNDWKMYNSRCITRQERYNLLIDRYDSHNSEYKSICLSEYLRYDFFPSKPQDYDNAIYKVLDGEFELTSYNGIERVYPLGMNDIFLSSAIYRIRNVGGGALLRVDVKMPTSG